MGRFGFALLSTMIEPWARARARAMAMGERDHFEYWKPSFP